MQPIKQAFKAVFQALLCLGLLLFVKTAPEPSPGVYEPDPDIICLVSAIYHEARGEPVKGKRAVLEVVLHRAERYGKSVCEVVAQKRQFPWFQKKGLVPLNSETLLHYNQALEHEPVLRDENTLWFFSGPRPVWSYKMKCRKEGRHWFCKM